MSKAKNTGIEIYNNVTLEQAAQLVARGGHRTTYLFQGPTGIGKSTILKMIKNLGGRFEYYRFCYMDVTTMDLGDVMMPKFFRLNSDGDQVPIDEPGMDVAAFIPNAGFGLQFNQPLVIMLDEFGKGTTSVKNALLPTILERRVGTNPLPSMPNPLYKPGNGEPEMLESIVFATTNLAAEGLGDTLQAHQRNRICITTIRTPTDQEWIQNFAMDAGVHPVIMAAVDQFPNMLGSFDQYASPADNPYIFFPKEPRDSFTSPRSLEKASNVLYDTEGMDLSVRGHALRGVVGGPATAEIMSLLQMNEKLPTWREITTTPDKATVPTSPAAIILLIYTAVQQVEKSTVKAWLKYQKKLSREAQALFATTVLRSQSKASTVGSAAEFITWAQSNSFLFGQ